MHKCVLIIGKKKWNVLAPSPVNPPIKVTWAKAETLLPLWHRKTSGLGRWLEFARALYALVIKREIEKVEQVHTAIHLWLPSYNKQNIAIGSQSGGRQHETSISKVCIDILGLNFGLITLKCRDLKVLRERNHGLRRYEARWHSSIITASLRFCLIISHVDVTSHFCVLLLLSVYLRLSHFSQGLASTKQFLQGYAHLCAKD